MSIGSIGSTPSFWQQDQNYWQQTQENDNTSAASDSVINAISSAETDLGKGLASIANQTALNRTNSELSAAIENVLKPGGTSDTSSSSSSTVSSSAGSSGSSGSSANTSGAPASGTGTTPLTTGATLSTLGILAGGTITVSAGPNLTTYTSTGTDTVGDLINAINVDLPTNAQVTASLNPTGHLIITSRNDSDAFTVGGSGTDAAVIGFGTGNNTFLPTAASTSATASSNSSSASGASNTSSASSSNNTSTSTKSTKSYATLASETASSAASLLSDSGAGGTLVDMLA